MTFQGRGVHHLSPPDSKKNQRGSKQPEIMLLYLMLLWEILTTLPEKSLQMNEHLNPENLIKEKNFGAHSEPKFFKGSDFFQGRGCPHLRVKIRASEGVFAIFLSWGVVHTLASVRGGLRPNFGRQGRGVHYGCIIHAHPTRSSN